ncbi:putative ankyrin repeat domain-containing protein 26-like protein [Vicugna pacos]|uniref:Ankyrin repeat domain-containing protein 26-like protein n=1 Tax=Vicugna pacos TaxID=30538 RepID=A0ABM5DLD5_VICPA
MSRFFCVCRASCESPVGCTISPQRDRRNSQPGYHIHRRDLKKIHRAACAGDVRKVQRVLFLRQNGLDERDRKNRTALHLASANGHGGVVTLLLERGCQIDARDRKKRTALIKAVQCEAEECVEILLKSGANVNAADVLGNTALHYAACLDTASIAEKLLSHAADMDMRNQDDLTPLLLARRNNRQLMADFLKEKQAHMPTVEKTKSEHKDERRRETPFQTTSLAKTSDCK